MKLSQAISEFRDWRGFKVTGQTVIRYDHVLRIFCLCLGDPYIEQIQIQHVLGYLKDMERLGWKRNGITIVCLSLRKLFEFFNMRGYKCLNENLIPLPRKEFKIPRIASEPDFKKLVRAIPKDHNPSNIRNRALAGMVWDTWARSGEIVSIDESDLKFNKDGTGSALIKTEKSRGRRPVREIFWTKETTRHLKKWLDKKHHLETLFTFKDYGAVFVSVNKSGMYDTRGSRMTNRGVTEVFRLMSRRAGISMLNPHSARHFGGREIIKKGGSSADVSNILGHSHMDSSAIYTMMHGDDLKDRWKKFHRIKKDKARYHHVFHGSLKH
jgi:integrase/recombinase XerC